MVRSVLVICSGNLCRSPVGERLLRRACGNLRVDSAGTVAVAADQADPLAQHVSLGRGLTLEGHVPRSLTQEMARQYDLLLVMEPEHLRQVSALAPWARARQCCLAIGPSTAPFLTHTDVAWPFSNLCLVCWSRMLCNGPDVLILILYRVLFMLANSNTPLSTSLPDKEIDLLHLVVTLLSHWKQIVALSLLSGLMALLFAMTAAPQYQADVLIQVEKKQNGLLPGGLDSLMPELSTGTASETELLRSRMILGKTVRDAGLQTVVNPVYFPVVGHAWARLTNNMVKLPTIHQYITTDPAPWVLQVVDSTHYTLTKDTTRLEGKVGQPLQDGGLSLEISALNAPAGSRFTLSRLTEQEAIQELKKT